MNHYIKPLSNVDEWPEYIIRILTPPSYFLSKLIVSIFIRPLYRISYGMMRFSLMLISASQRGLIIRGWYEINEDGNVILEVSSKSH